MLRAGRDIENLLVGEVGHRGQARQVGDPRAATGGDDDAPGGQAPQPYPQILQGPTG
jgi:hypothetical protein